MYKALRDIRQMSESVASRAGISSHVLTAEDYVRIEHEITRGLTIGSRGGESEPSLLGAVAEPSHVSRADSDDAFELTA